MKKLYDVLIVGGGLAGLTAAIHLARKDLSVCVVEKDSYPRHRVCGEYVSNEIVPYLTSLGVSLEATHATIDTLWLSTVAGLSTEIKLPLGGVGISRYAFDHLLYQRALELGVRFVFQSATSIVFKSDFFECLTSEKEIYHAEVAIGAFGKRSSIDKQLHRDFINNKSAWLGVKCHYRYDDFPTNKVALHNFDGGYGGLSKTETGAVNFCYLTSYESFKRYKDVENFNDIVVRKNPFLKEFFENAEPLFNAPLTIAQISFAPKKAVEKHLLMCGDSAGLIHPLCGNGMAMAIHSAKIASERILDYFNLKNYDRERLESDYQSAWASNFETRLRRGRQLQAVLLNESISKMAMATVAKSSWLLRNIIKQTHGKPIECAEI